ncbi:MAG: UvrD-helicase domain-containing protein [Deltaproteobacteria bacterium]|jgi:DNA helicase-2/ATP-dependent DNA helicase PcrA|nr:UvrD-helicase domain-containing protein [Deltaproteobacteria bacterium]
MSRSFVDLHIHSRYSRATSPSLDPVTISRWAKTKGLDLVGTGDMTHPAWLGRLREALEMGPDGFYRLAGEPGGPAFVPTGEVSAIYKQGGRTRKIHLVVVAPDLGAAERFGTSLGRLGNVTSDGRPILGLSARNILEIALEADPAMEVIPAHVWTPWFSIFGSKSGFDAVEECFGDLTGHIRALETGLSSDPEMNRLVSALDRYALVSSSDAHSPDKLGREATVIEGPLDFAGLKRALGGGDNLVGTVEFFPEEGKYHLDGHAQCGPALTPAETKALGGICPVCGKPLTVGVLSRVLELADRETAPGGRLPDWHLLPLAEVLAQTLDVGTASREVARAYERLVAEFGSEYGLLLDTPLDDVREVAGPVLARAIERMRLGEVEASGGYDGKYGRITVIGRRERLELSGEGLLFGAPAPAKRGRRKAEPESGPPKTKAVVKRRVASGGLLGDLSSEQQQAVTFGGPALALSAGPGAGKTLALVRRAVFLIRNGSVAPEKLLLTTYTRKAAETLSQRLVGLLGPAAEKVTVCTLHALALGLANRRKPGFRLADEELLSRLAADGGKACGISPRRFQNLVSLRKNRQGLDGDWLGEDPGSPVNAALALYQRILRDLGLWDYDDLILEAAGVEGLGEDGAYSAVLADEFQDFSLTQYGFLMRLAKNASLTVIGDPDQSVYGFRGAHGSIFERLAGDRRDLVRMDLSLNFRSTPAICQAAEAVRPEGGAKRSPARQGELQRIGRAVLDGPEAEAAWVAGRIAGHLGVTDLGPSGSHAGDRERLADLGLADVAVIFRLRHVGQAMAEALGRAGFPYQMAGEEEERATDGLDFKADKISLLTMHASKGLEFRLVFVIGLEEGLCPYDHGGEDFDADEERRLFYVAVTRARDMLYLTRSSKRFMFGRALPGKPSPYWSLLPVSLCHEHKAAYGARAKRKAQGSGPRLF